MRRIDDTHKLISPILRKHVTANGQEVSSQQARELELQFTDAFGAREADWRGDLARYAVSETIDGDLRPVVAGYMKNHSASGPPSEYFTALKQISDQEENQ